MCVCVCVCVRARVCVATILSPVQNQQTFLENLARVQKDGMCSGDVALEIKDWTQPSGDVESSVDLTINSKKIPVLFCNDPPVWSRFDFGKFNRHLATQEMGRMMMYSELTSSTQAILSG